MSLDDDLRGEIERGAEALEVSIEASGLDRLMLYLSWLMRWNQSINLIGPCSAHEAIGRHLIDSLALLRLLDDPELNLLGRPWFDVGAGAGIPGLVLSAVRPGLELHVVEPRGRRATFCKQVGNAMGLEGLHVHAERLEALDLPAGSGAISRATFSPEEWAKVGAEVVGPGGHAVVMMGASAPEELVDRAWRVDRLLLPTTGHTRVNAIFRGR
jgi:16S rRNA (guanine527-N7)-methyltransferase